MSAIITFVQANMWLVIAGGFGLGMLVILLVQLCLLRRVNKVQRKINAITEKVGRYLEVIMAPEPETQSREADMEIRVSEEKMRKEEEQNRIISSMLQEIFP